MKYETLMFIYFAPFPKSLSRCFLFPMATEDKCHQQHLIKCVVSLEDHELVHFTSQMAIYRSSLKGRDKIKPTRTIYRKSNPFSMSGLIYSYTSPV